MDVLNTILLILHFIGIASLLGSFLVQLRDIRGGTGKMLPGMLHGALTMLVTGLGLLTIAELGPGSVNHAKITVKLAVLIAALVIVLIYRKREHAPAWALWLTGGLTTANIVLAVAW